MAFSAEIIAWYNTHKRDLPWRHTADPYLIWLSEVILQQTRVAQGLPYFHRFLSHYPTVEAFAEAPEEEILLHWQGLGYYSRARNMHHAAKAVVAEYGGVFPNTYSELVKLKGIGEYTAAAIASFSANEAKAVLDGNVFRVLARYFGIDEPINSSKGKKLFLTLANDLLDKKHPGLYNQAIMEFGAIQCKPSGPDCGDCVLRFDCRALVEKRVNQLPVKRKGRASRNRYFNYFVVIKGDQILVNQRRKDDIWENLYELPLVETPAPVNLPELATHAEVVEAFGPKAELRLITGPVKHVLSHQNLFAQFVAVDMQGQFVDKKNKWNYVFIKDLGKLAKPKLIYSFLEDYSIE